MTISQLTELLEDVAMPCTVEALFVQLDKKGVDPALRDELEERLEYHDDLVDYDIFYEFTGSPLDDVDYD